MHHHFSPAAALILAALPLAPARAQSVSADLPVQPTEPAPSLCPPPDPEWTVQIEPSFWYVAPSGKVKLPANSGTGNSASAPGDSVKIERLNLDSPRFEPTGEVHFSGGRLRFTFSGATYSVERDDTTADSSFRLGSVNVASGDALDVKFDFSTVEVTGGYRVWGRDFCDADHTQSPLNAIGAVARLYVIGGGRFYNTSFEVTRLTRGIASAEADQFFGEPILGVRAEADLARNFTLDLQITAGGLPLGQTSSFSGDIQAGFHWRPFANVGFQFGYRQLAFWLSDGEDAEEFEYNGRLAGLYAGLEVRF